MDFSTFQQVNLNVIHSSTFQEIMQTPEAYCSKISSFTYTIFLIFFFLFCSSSANGQQQALFSPIRKDNVTKLFSIQAYLGTPLHLTNLHLDLGATYNWVECATYQSTTYQHVPYNASLCRQLDERVAPSGNCDSPPSLTCFNDSCLSTPQNSVTRQYDSGFVLLDSFALPTTDGRNPGSKLALVSSFEFSCARSIRTSLLTGLATGVTGLAALGRSNFSLPAQVSRALSNSPFVFAICPPGTTSGNGVAIFNSYGPYSFLPGIDVSGLLTYTPLLLNPFDQTFVYYVRPSDEYFIGVTGIRVNGKPIPVNATLLTINQTTGLGGTKISTSTPYTIMQTSIFKAFKAAFKAATNSLKLSSIAPVKPFSLCYRADKTPSTRLGPAVPTIDLVLQGDNLVWSISGANSMVKVGNNALCLGFLDGGLNPKASIVIGGLQVEDNLLQFDLVSKRLGFSNSLLSRRTSCSNFNFTTSN